MELRLLNTACIAKLFEDTEYECDCGRRHEFLTQEVAFGAGEMSSLLTAVTKAAPPYAKIALLYDKKAKAVFDRTLGKRLVSGGFRVCEVVVGENMPLGSTDEANEIELDEDVRAIVAAGGEELLAVAKYKAAQARVSLTLIPLSPACLNVLSPSAILLDGGIEQVFKTPPPISVVFDTELAFLNDGIEVAAAFGAIASKLVGLFDYRFSSLVNKEFFCKELFDLSYAIIDGLINNISMNRGSLKDRGACIAEASLKLSAISQLMGNSRLFCGGEAQGAHALRLLFLHEERRLKTKGENELLLARLVLQTYKNALSRDRLTFVPPPDNNLRLEKIAEYFGLDETKVIKRMRPILDSESQKLHAYRVGEFHDELVLLLSDFDFKLKTVWKSFKRLYNDDGYSLVNYLDDSDVLFALSFAPDLKEKFTMLTYLKDAGMLEEYDEAIAN